MINLNATQQLTTPKFFQKLSIIVNNKLYACGWQINIGRFVLGYDNLTNYDKALVAAYSEAGTDTLDEYEPTFAHVIDFNFDAPKLHADSKFNSLSIDYGYQRNVGGILVKGFWFFLCRKSKGSPKWTLTFARTY